MYTNNTAPKLIGSAIISSLVLLGASGVAFAQTTVPPGSNVTDPPAVYTGIPPVVYNPATTPTNTSATNTTGTAASGTTNTIGTTGATNSAPVTGATNTVTPGIPNTGAGGDMATNIVLLVLSALAVLGAAAYALRGRIA